MHYILDSEKLKKQSGGKYLKEFFKVRDHVEFLAIQSSELSNMYEQVSLKVSTLLFWIPSVRKIKICLAFIESMILDHFFFPRAYILTTKNTQP